MVHLVMVFRGWHQGMERPKQIVKTLRIKNKKAGRAIKRTTFKITEENVEENTKNTELEEEHRGEPVVARSTQNEELMETEEINGPGPVRR